MGDVEVDEDDDEWQPVEQSQVHVTAFQGTEGKRQNATLNWQPIAYTCEGVWFSTNTRHVIWKRTVNATLAIAPQADPVHC